MDISTNTYLNRCIWMDAEVIDYHICQLEYNCDACELHQRITNPKQSTIDKTSIITINIEDPQTDSFQPGVQYYQNHIWIKHISMNQVHVGVDNIFFNL